MRKSGEEQQRMPAQGPTTTHVVTNNYKWPQIISTTMTILGMQKCRMSSLVQIHSKRFHRTKNRQIQLYILC